MPQLQAIELTKRYGTVEVVHGVNFEIEDGEFVVLVGESGCGKSTILRMIAGLEDISGGELRFDGEVINGMEPRDRGIAMVFQDYALYPHMSVAENIAFSLEIAGVKRDERTRRVAEVAEVLQITKLLERKPRELSGGQRQRVAMGRALIRNPSFFLFDEPLSNLDAKLRGTMRGEIKRLHKRLKTTIIYVTHDQVEAMTLADRIICLDGGVIAQVGRPEELYNEPVNLFVAQFIGSPPMNFLNGRLVSENGSIALALEGGARLQLPDDLGRRYSHAIDTDLVVGIRPEHITEQCPEDAYSFSGAIEMLEPLGSDTLVHARLGSSIVVGRILPGAVCADASEIDLHINLTKLHLFDVKSGLRLDQTDT